jgi:hypothetical protein
MARPTLFKNLATQRQIVAKITPTNAGANIPTFPDYFTQVSGGEITAAVEKVYHGGDLFPETLCAPAEIGDITLTGYVSTDGVFLAKLQELRQKVGRIRYNIDIHVFDCDIQVPGADRQYTSALLVGLTEPDGDATSGTPATFAMTFSISTVSVGNAPQTSASA